MISQKHDYPYLMNNLTNYLMKKRESIKITSKWINEDLLTPSIGSGFLLEVYNFLKKCEVVSIEEKIVRYSDVEKFFKGNYTNDNIVEYNQLKITTKTGYYVIPIPYKIHDINDKVRICEYYKIISSLLKLEI